MNYSAAGWAWVKGKKRPFVLYHEIVKGRDKDKIRITLLGRGVIISKRAVESWPEEG